ncbi:MAG: hypothetical protein QM504_09165 [Pseudomonadota bacterium]
MKSIINNIILLSSLIFSAQAISSINITNPSTDTVHLKKDCAGINNCATTLSELIPWIWNTRQPNSSNPLLVKISTGTFLTLAGSIINSGSFCKNAGFVTFMGSGKENTILKNPGASDLNGISITNCQKLSFQDLTFDFKNTIYGIFWNGGGNSNFNNIQLIGGGPAWYDEGCPSSEQPTHYFIGSQISAKSNLYGVTTAYFTRCADTWFIGSEIVAESNGIPVSTIFADGISSMKPEVHIYGSSLRAISAAGVNTSELLAVHSKNASVHIHGTGIDVISFEGNNITALRAEEGGSIHANQSGFVMKTGNGGTKSRLSEIGSGKIIAPYVWGDISVAAGVTSIHGADISVSTDNADQQPHLLIYSANCSSSWFDSTLNQCRN